MSIEHSPAKQQKRGFTISEFCERWGWSRPYFYAMRRAGDAPDVIGEGKGQRISDVAEARWLKRQEAKAKARKAESGTMVAL
jgi:hypothetical protein